MIASFKKMKALTSDRSLILKAVQNSSIVEVRMISKRKDCACIHHAVQCKLSLSLFLSLSLTHSLTHSLTQLSEDKQLLRRVAPMPSLSSADVDSRTIYVENLSPQGTDHDSVRNMFKLFGTITYVR